MALLRVYSRVNKENKIAIPRGIRKCLDIKPGDRLELTITGMNKAKKLILAKIRGRYRQ